MNAPAEKLEEPVRLQYMEVLRSASYNSFNHRRSYEWKLSFAIWTALAVMVAGLVQPLQIGEVFPLHGTRYGIAATALGLLIVLLHIYWNNGIARASVIDRSMALFYSKQMRSALDLHFNPELKEQLKALPKRPKIHWLQWSHAAQIGITTLLTIVAVAILWVRVIA